MTHYYKDRHNIKDEEKTPNEEKNKDKQNTSTLTDDDAHNRSTLWDWITGIAGNENTKYYSTSHRGEEPPKTRTYENTNYIFQKRRNNPKKFIAKLYQPEYGSKRNLYTKFEDEVDHDEEEE